VGKFTSRYSNGINSRESAESCHHNRKQSTVKESLLFGRTTVDHFDIVVAGLLANGACCLFGGTQCRCQDESTSRPDRPPPCLSLSNQSYSWELWFAWKMLGVFDSQHSATTCR